MSPKPPVIIIGMHRSGTSMLTRTLQGFGFFMGRGTSRNEECRFTNAMNYWVFNQASATWENPHGVDLLIACDDVRQLVVDYLRGVTEGPASIRYLGTARWLRSGSMHGVQGAWGWKDPRNTFTLPLWLDVFPNARVLHIMRHGIDVAQSLRVRRRQAFAHAAARYRKRRAMYVNNPFAPKRSGFAHSVSVADLRRGLSLWHAYTARAQEHVKALGGQALELRYEDLLMGPEQHLDKIVRFCGLQAASNDIQREAERFRPDRAYAYRQDPELAECARSCASTLESLGYEA